VSVLITGGLGVIGTQLTLELRRRGYDVVVSDTRILKEPGYRRGDITQYVEMDRIFKEFRVEHVFHLAGEVGRENGEEFPRRCVDINVSGTLNLVQLCLEHSANLYFASTSEVYGHASSGQKVTEEMVDSGGLFPTNVYGISKLQAEHYLRHFAGNYGLKALSYRFFMCYGEGERPNPYRSAMANFVHRVLNEEPITVHRGTARSWCYISDIVEGIIAGMERGAFQGYEAYNIGREGLMPMEEVATLICRLAGKSPSLIRLSEPGRFVTPIKDASFDKAKRELGFEAGIDLEEGIRRTIAWQRANVPPVTAAVGVA
jgi:nucleoside-diphosphate-sugar epimerase